MPDISRYTCSRPNDTGGVPANYTCTLELVDDAWIGSSGTWKAQGTSPTKIFVVQSGKWVLSTGQITLDSNSGVQSERVLMRNANAASGTLMGDGLVGGHVVTWTRT